MNVIRVFYPGYGGLSLSIEGPSKADIHCDDNADGTCKVSYKPTEPGNYFVNVKFADEHVPGTMFQLFVHSSTTFLSGMKIFPKKYVFIKYFFGIERKTKHY